MSFQAWPEMDGTPFCPLSLPSRDALVQHQQLVCASGMHPFAASSIPGGADCEMAATATRERKRGETRRPVPVHVRDLSARRSDLLSSSLSPALAMRFASSSLLFLLGSHIPPLFIPLAPSAVHPCSKTPPCE
eukprot:2495369-Rhodomonas_salina.2